MSILLPTTPTANVTITSVIHVQGALQSGSGDAWKPYETDRQTDSVREKLKLKQSRGACTLRQEI